MPIVAATKESIARAGEALARGEIVAFPTETVYGLGANALDASAVAKVFAAKARPRFNPLIVHVLGIEQAETYAEVDETARKLIDAFWPGPLTLVLPRKRNCTIADLVSAGLDTMALRAPSHPVARALLDAAMLPIAARKSTSQAAPQMPPMQRSPPQVESSAQAGQTRASNTQPPSSTVRSDSLTMSSQSSSTPLHTSGANGAMPGSMSLQSWPRLPVV